MTAKRAERGTQMNIKSKISRIDRTLAELIAGIILSGVIAGIIGIFFVSHKAGFCISLCIGTFAAGLLAVHMYVTLSRMMDMHEDDRDGYIRRSYVLRFIFMAALVLCGLKIPALHFPGLFLGLLTLKASVYLRPLTHPLVGKLYGDSDAKENDERR